MYYKESNTGYASIDKPWLKYYKDVEELKLPKMSIYQLAKKMNEGNMKKIALDLRTSSNDFKRGIKITYDNLFKRIDQSAVSSLGLGYKPDEIIPIILPNLVESRILIYSNSKIGATSYPISPLLPNNSLESIIKENNIKNIVIFSQFYDKYLQTIKNCNLDSILYLDGTESLPKSIKQLKKLKDKLSSKNNIPLGDQILSWDEYCKLGKNPNDIEPYYSENHIATIIGTSGTTGVPKGVRMTDDNVNAAALNYENSKNFNGSFTDILMPSIGYGVSVLHLETIGGHTTYLIPELVTNKIDTLIQNTKPDNFPGGPIHYINLSQSEIFKQGKLYKGKNYISGGASLNKEIEKTMNGVDENYKENGIINDDLYCRQGFGLTENIAVATYSKRGTYKFGSVGIPLPYVTIGIFKPNTDEELKYNQQGEICITGPTVMEGYLNQEEETKKVIKIHKDGKRWIHTKDIGYMDPDGNLFHVERIKNIFMRTGFNVHPNKISEFLNSLSPVLNSYVAGFDHPTEQCVPVAFIEVKNKEQSFKEIEEQIKKECYENLEETSVPYDYVFVDTLPINAGGKIDGIAVEKKAEIDFYKNKTLTKKHINFKE